jgi:putative nucleotidyltransferase with HDIG domain
MPETDSIKKIGIGQLCVGMYVHDLNCSWIDHPFATNSFLVHDSKRLAIIRNLGVRELYIDTTKGTDMAGAPRQEEVPEEVGPRMVALVDGHGPEPVRTALADEITRARNLHLEANRVVHSMLQDIRLGKHIQMEQVEPLVEKVVDSIFRNQDALLPLAQLKQHDNYTFQHSVSVCALMVAFAREQRLERPLIKEIAIGALLHDVGKAKVPDEILNKPAKLTEAEFTEMKSHVVQSILILQNTPGISQIALDVAGQHHERFDGSGYPNKLGGDGISKYGRMAAIVDVYDALTSDRVYHKGMAPTAALGRLLEWSKFHFDPDLVKTYIKSVGIYPTGSLVRLESGRLGVVQEQHPDKLTQPKLLLVFHALRKHYLRPERLDLARPGCQDRITGHEEYKRWGMDPGRWLPQ